jgi:AraC-like DNA-binding protein
MSIAHFSRLFRQATERSPYQYLIQLRCEKACELLASGQYTVTEAAHAVGFFDHSHFIRHFKRQYHVTPSEWLKNQSHKGYYFDLAGRDDG